VVVVSNDLLGAVTLNLALDITYDVDALTVGASHRVRTVRQRAGGKGVNVARVAHELGYDVLALGFVGGMTGELIAADLFDAGLTALLTPVAGESRRSVAVVDTGAGDATVFNEPGPVVDADEWRAFCDRVPWGRLGVLACSGSLPPGLPADAYAELTARARHHGVPAVIDAGGAALVASAKAGALVRANAAELREALAAADGTAGRVDGDGRPEPAGERAQVDVAAGARRLIELGATGAVITDGAAGMVAVTAKGAWRALPVERVRGNPTGAGDACTAVVAAAVAGGNEDWPDVLRSAVAASAAAVLTPVAGDIEVEAYRRWRPRVVVQAV
jgi:tagatose 6-phosphate kinase